jgi:hypothetical protein
MPQREANFYGSILHPIRPWLCAMIRGGILLVIRILRECCHAKIFFASINRYGGRAICEMGTQAHAKNIGHREREFKNERRSAQQCLNGAQNKTRFPLQCGLRPAMIQWSSTALRCVGNRKRRFVNARTSSATQTRSAKRHRVSTLKRCNSSSARQCSMVLWTLSESVLIFPVVALVLPASRANVFPILR